ncbi:hypothetical protein RHS01_03641 [Rhizoctonia solani]|uniref:CCHC-type domain-containing protein n=1 Tax=Rhizoctonia solani TaxID=456999 RepID=A0A8H7M8L3_9AGAM|nr:hypothetical protein RHS01_03641 [Rhizoctonia solani]
MEPEPTTAALLKAILNLTNQVRSLQAQISSQGQQLAELKAICKETNNLVGDKDQGKAQTKPGPLTGPVTPPTHSGGSPHSRHGFDSEDKEPRLPKKSLKERLEGTWDPSPPSTQGPAQGRRLGPPHHWEYHQGQGNPPTTIQALTAKFKEAFANPNAKRAAARKIAALSQSTTTSKYEAYIAQFTRGLHWKVKELLSTKDSIPDDLKAIFAAAIKIDNIRRKNEENQLKEEDPNYVTPEEQDRRRTSGLCVKCGQKGHGIKQCPNGWKATIKEAAKIGEVVELEKE